MSNGLFRLSPLAVRLIEIIAFAVILATGGTQAKSTTNSSHAPVPTSFGTTGYFFTIDLDPRYQIIGKGALTEEAAAVSNCYCLTYDMNGRLERVEYRRADRPIADPLFQTARIDFEYGPGVEHRWYRNEHGQPLNNADGIAGELLALNPAGFPVSVTNLDAAGKPVRDGSWVIRYDRTLDQHNRLISARRTGLLGIDITDGSGLFETRTVYDNQGRRMEYGNYDSAGNPLDDNDGVALTRTTYTLYPDSTAVIESYFDASGLAVAEKSSGVHQRQRTYDNRGLLLSESYFDVTGAPTLDEKMGIHEHRYEYDDRGELLAEDFFGIDGKPKNEQPDGYARVAYQYDNQNRIITKSYFGDDGAPQVLLNLGAAVIRQEYDDQGNLVRRQFFDGQGNPSLHKRYGAPAIRIQVEGDTTIITLRDAHDEITQNWVTGYAGFSYKTATDHPLSRKNHFFDRRGRSLSRLRVFIINPHLHALRSRWDMAVSARGGAAAAGIGALLAMFIALRKASFTRRQKVYVPAPWERFLGWLGIFAIFEGIIRFFITIWWAYVGYQNGRMGYGIYVLEGLVLVFFAYRLFRMRLTMRVLNVSRADIHGILREFFAKAHIEPQWIEERESFETESLRVRVRYFPRKSHAYLSFSRHNRGGVELARALAEYIRKQAASLESFPHSRAIAFYYPSVAFCYFLLALVAFYTFWQVVKKY
jgi:YD repeat-containing protein